MKVESLSTMLGAALVGFGCGWVFSKPRLLQRQRPTEDVDSTPSTESSSTTEPTASAELDTSPATAPAAATTAVSSTAAATMATATAAPLPIAATAAAGAEKDPLITRTVQCVEALLLGINAPKDWSSDDLKKALRVWYPDYTPSLSMNAWDRERAIAKLADAVAKRVAARELPPDFAAGALTPTKQTARDELKYWTDRIDELVEACMSQGSWPQDGTVERALPVNIPGTHMWLGSCLEAREPASLKRDGFTHVLNCARSKDTCFMEDINDDFGNKIRAFHVCESLFFDTGITYGEIGAVDTQNIEQWSPLMLHRNFLPSFEGKMRYGESCEPSKMLSGALEHLEKAKAGGGKVLVHCVQGLNRSAFVCVAYLVLKCDIDMMKAFETVFVARKDERCLYNPVFRKQLIVLSHHADQLEWGEEGRPTTLPRSTLRRVREEEDNNTDDEMRLVPRALLL
mmetsp:Transcript_22287/g.35955  ORF Transcript_22287/g.35955 Transcript_22287/m.35955 type:complete len:457 (+) Transcript_22287:82-1452(+)